MCQANCGEASIVGGHLAALVGTAGAGSDVTVTGDGSAPHVLPAPVQAVATISGPTDLVRLGNPFVSSLLGGPPRERADLARLASPLTFITPPVRSRPS